MAFTARLRPEVEADAKAYADRVGLSLNALLSVALRDYLDARLPMRPSVAPSQQPPAPAALAPAPLPPSQPQPPPTEARRYPAPKSRSDPCPCGSRLKWKQCHGRSQPT